jgi:agmatinase
VDHSIDVIDPASAPGTGRPEAGLLPAHGLAIFRRLSSIDFVSCDVVEVIPGYDPLSDRDACR